jgi:hypothetical protein
VRIAYRKCQSLVLQAGRHTHGHVFQGTYLCFCFFYCKKISFSLLKQLPCLDAGTVRIKCTRKHSAWKDRDGSENTQIRKHNKRIQMCMIHADMCACVRMCISVCAGTRKTADILGHGSYLIGLGKQGIADISPKTTVLPRLPEVVIDLTVAKITPELGGFWTKSKTKSNKIEQIKDKDRQKGAAGQEPNHRHK